MFNIKCVLLPLISGAAAPVRTLDLDGPLPQYDNGFLTE